MDRAEFETRLEGFVTTLGQFIADHYKTSSPILYEQGLYPKIEVMRGPKFIRIVDAGPGQRSVHCFLDYQGNIYKAAGWKAPAKHIRGSIFDENFSIGKAVTVYGAAYLR